MTPRFSLLDHLTLAVFAVQAAYALHIGFNGPTTPLPLHFGPDLRPDRWGDRVEFAVVCGGLTLVGFIAAISLALAARRAAKDGDVSRRRSLRTGQGILLFAFAAIGLMIAWLSLGGAPLEDRGAILMGGLSLIFLVLGGFVGRVSPNRLVGVRTPWSYGSRLAWDRSNRLAGRLFFLLGLAGVIAAPVAPQPLALHVLTGAVIASAALSAFESWRVWRADPDRTSL